jgi:hypothetical protein
MMDAFLLAAGLALPWFLGMAAIAATRSRDEPFDVETEIAWIAGVGYLAGAFLLTLWMRALSQVGIRFGVVSIALPLTIATEVLVLVTLRRDRALLTVAPRNALRALVLSPGLSGGARLIWWLLVGWLALRFALLGLEVTWQPLYPLGCLDPMGDQGARLVRIGLHRAVCSRSGMACVDGRRLFRRFTRVSTDRCRCFRYGRASRSATGTMR